MKIAKILIMIVLAFGVSMSVGAAIAPVIDFNPVDVGGVLFGASQVLGIVLPKGVMPMAISITSGYAGEVLDELLVRASTYNELVERRLIRMVPNIGKKYYIPRLKAGQMLQKRKEQPTSSDSKGDFTIDERVLEPDEFMAYTEFNPRSLENLWRPFQPTGALVFRELPPDVQSKFLAELAKVVDFELGGHFINGEFGSTDDELFNGILTRIVADGDTVSISGAVPLTSSNIISAGLKPVLAAAPKAIRNKKGLKFLMSIEDGDKYDDNLTSREQKGKDETERNAMRYKGIPIETLADWPENVIVLTITGDGLDTNLWAGVDFADDDEVIQIDKVTNAGEKYFFKMLMKADTNTAWGEDCILYDGRPEV